MLRMVSFKGPGIKKKPKTFIGMVREVNGFQLVSENFVTFEKNGMNVL